MVKVPFLVIYFRSWKELAGTYRENPEKVDKIFETIMRTQDLDGNDIQVVLGTLLTLGERIMVIAKAREEVERVYAQNVQQGMVDRHFPLADPWWDPKNLGQRELLIQYQRSVIFEMKHAIPKAINMSALYQVVQGKDLIFTSDSWMWPESTLTWIQKGREMHYS